MPEVGEVKLTKSFEQAVCIVVMLSTQEKGVPLATDAISNKLGVSPTYLKKIVRKLVVAGIVIAVPGNNGGLQLARHPHDITALDIIEAIAGPISLYEDTGLIGKVFEGGRNTERGLRVLQSLFEEASALLKQYFSGITAADLFERCFEGFEMPERDWNRGGAG
jgi:Rrf2 family protein